MIQYKIENLSQKTLQMEEVGKFFKENVGKVSSVLKVLPHRIKEMKNNMSGKIME
jgi:hypothetical protein